MDYGVEVRFIEMMPIDQGYIKWNEGMVKPLNQVREKIEEKYGRLIPSTSIGSGAARVYEILKLGVKVNAMDVGTLFPIVILRMVIFTFILFGIFVYLDRD